MSEAKEKLQAAIDALGLAVTAQFVPFSQSRNKGEETPSLNWLITVTRAGRDVLTTDYMAGCGHCPVSRSKHSIYTNKRVRARAVALECETGKKVSISSWRSEPVPGREAISPDPVNVIWSLSRDTDVLDYGTFEEWASSLGYDPDSRTAEAVYRACLEIALKLRAAIGEAGIEALREAGENY